MGDIEIKSALILVGIVTGIVILVMWILSKSKHTDDRRSSASSLPLDFIEAPNNFYFKIHKSSADRQYYVSFLAGNHETMWHSEGYKRRRSADEAVALIRENAATAGLKCENC